MKTLKGKNVSVDRKQGDCYPWKAKGPCTKGNACTFRHAESGRGKVTQLSSLAPRLQTQNDGKFSSKGKSPKRRSPCGKRYQRPCRFYLNGICTNPSCDSRHPPVCQKYESESGCKFGEQCMFRHKEVDRAAKQKANKEWWQRFCCLIEEFKAVALCSQDVQPPKSKSILRKGTTFLEPKRSVQFSTGTGHTVKNSGKKGSIPRCSSSILNLMTPMLQKLSTYLRKKP